MESSYFASRYDSVTLTIIVLVPRTGTRWMIPPHWFLRSLNWHRRRPCCCHLGGTAAARRPHWRWV